MSDDRFERGGHALEDAHRQGNKCHYGNRKVSHHDELIDVKRGSRVARQTADPPCLTFAGVE